MTKEELKNDIYCELRDRFKHTTDQGTANYLGKEIREICGMVETEQLLIHSVIVPNGTLSDFEKWLDKKENESYCGLPSQYVLDKYKSLNAL